MSALDEAAQERISVPDLLALLADGELALQGQVPWSSNFTFLVTVTLGGRQALAVYKPLRGTRPLWDFPVQSLCRREVAAYVVSQYLGWPAIPPVVLRRGPHGVGSVQLYVENDIEAHFFTLREEPTYLPALQRIALFDYVVNNADRKGGHVLKGTEGQVWAIDHGLTFHVDYKLRTVIWDYAGQPIPPDALRALQSLRDQLASSDGPLVQGLTRLVEEAEIAMVARRLETLLRRGIFPMPRRDWRNVPYPLV